MGDSIRFLSIDEQAVLNRSVNLEEAASNLRKLQEHIFYPQSSKNHNESSAYYPKPSTECPESTPDCKHCTRSDPERFSDYPKSLTGHPGGSEAAEDHSRSTYKALQNLSASRNTAHQPNAFVAMAAGKEVALSSGKANFYERQPSVNDEDLFGDGKKSQEYQSNTDLGTNDSIINEENLGAAEVGFTQSEADEDISAVNEIGGIPNFEMLGMSSSSKSNSSISPKPFEVKEPSTGLIDKSDEDHNKTEEGNVVFEYIQEPDSDFKMRFQGKRSISADDRRKKYRYSSGGEVFDHTINSIEEEYQVRAHFIKSNSLPDLVTCSSPSPVSPPRYHSNPQSDVRENLEKQFELKRVVEGPSNTPVSKEIPKVKRTVSIKEEPDYIPVKSEDDDAEKGNSPCEKHSTSSTEERRRILSSGYVTGSSEAGSQDKSDMETKRQISQISQGSSGVWTSQGSVEKAEAETNASSTKGIGTEVSQLAGLPPIDSALLQSTQSTGGSERQNVSLQFSGSGCNESGSTDSSLVTIIDVKTHEDVRKKSNEGPNKRSLLQGEVSVKGSQDVGSYVLPNLSIMGNKSHELSSSFRGLRVEEEMGIKSVGSNGKRSEDLKPEQHAIELKSPESFEPHSYGNLPYILLESFSLKGSSLAKVQEEEDKNRKAVETVYCREGCVGSPGFGQVEPTGSSATSSPGSSWANQRSPPEAVKRLEKYLLSLKNDELSPSELEKLYHILRGPDSLTSPYSHDKERSDTPGAQGFKDLTLDELEKASRCNFPQCKDTCCLKMQEVFRILKEEIPHIDPMYRLVTSYYRTLCQHSDSGCEETKCPVLFCSEILEWETYASNDPVKNLVKNIQQFFSNPTLKLFLPTSGKFHKLQSRMPKLEVKEFETHTPMFTLGKFGTAKVCFETQCQKLVVLKTYPLMECDHQLSLYTRLKDLDHPYIVAQLWMLEYDDKIQVCSLFAQGGSLEDYLNAVGPLPWSKVVRYMKQILLAVCQLHERGVVYLNWNSGNMLFPDDRRDTVQVGNFSLSCPLGCQWDIGSVKECLPYNICPPELFDLNYKLDFKTDAWGAGCLFYEMLSGSPFLHHLRHEDRRTVHRKIQKELSTNLPDLKSFSREKRVILDSCWQIKLEDRKELKNILHYIGTLRVR